jgi:hypothetical protein
VAVSTSREFDLTQLSAADARARRPILAALLAMVALASGLAIAFGVRGAIDREWPIYALIPVAVGACIVVALAWPLSMLLRPNLVRLSISDGGLSVTNARGRKRQVAWRDPRLSIYLWDRSLALSSKSAPYAVAIPRAGISTEIPAEAFRLVLAHTQVAAASDTQTAYSSGPDAGATLHRVTAGHPSPSP